MNRLIDRVVDRRPQLSAAPTQLAILGFVIATLVAAADLLGPFGSLAPVRRLKPAALASLGDDISSWLLQLSGAAALVLGAVIFLAVQAGGSIVATRRAKAILRSSSAAMLCWFTLLVVIVDALVLRFRIVDGNDMAISRAVSWSGLGLVAILVAVGAIFLEQVYFSDLYRLTRYFAQDITAKSVRDFGFIDGDARSLHIQRYNLDFKRTDPIGPLSEIFEYSLQAHDRVLLQFICDSLARRVTAASAIRFRAEQISSIYAQRLTPVITPASRNRERRAAGTADVCLYVIHFFVRNAANVRRRWRMPTGRHPFVFSALRMLRSIAPYAEYAQATGLIAEGISAMLLSARKEKPWATTEPYAAAGLVALDLWSLGRTEAAAELWRAYVLCHLTGDPGLFPLPKCEMPGELERIGREVEMHARKDADWIPASAQSLWLQMLPELMERSG